MEKEISTIIFNLEEQLILLEGSIFRLSCINNVSSQSYVNRQIGDLEKVKNNIKNEISKLRQIKETLISDNKTKNSLQEEISALDNTIIKLQNARNEMMPTNTKNRLTVIINYLIDTRNNIATHISQFGQTTPSYIQKMIDGAKLLCEEHEDIIKNIVDEPTITCVTQDPATTPTATADSDTPCFENGEELHK
ncbi:MAG: hypothetical protein IJ371_00650 [Clostridia bacterium]|nr:hypothetical protein [Clostridia bacterium]